MDARVNKDMIISDMLQIDPGIAAVLMASGMHCVGCPASQGESLEEAAMVHGLNEYKIKDLLQTAAPVCNRSFILYRNCSKHNKKGQNQRFAAFRSDTCQYLKRVLLDQWLIMFFIIRMACIHIVYRSAIFAHNITDFIELLRTVFGFMSDQII